ncbi:hypothetical protein GGR53DRAFT_101026 [Hypoxylon sp. FL1150]|nr:hypothetical protein GGR53DRAFT_101026 [Hypoxylon sp. FL1150]
MCLQKTFSMPPPANPSFIMSGLPQIKVSQSEETPKQPIVSQSDETPKHPVVTFCEDGLRYLKKRLQLSPYLSSDDLANLKVKCTGIDINSGMPKDEGLKVLEPKALDRMNAIAEANNLINDHAIPSLTVGHWHEARFLGDFYLRVLCEQERSTGKTLLELSPWRISYKCPDEYVTPSAIHWRIHFTLHMRDNSKPDTISFLTNEAPFKDGEVLLSEVWYILQSARRGLKKRYRNHNKASATIVSASGRYLRIVQGCVDSTGCVLRMVRYHQRRLGRQQTELGRTHENGLLALGRSMRRPTLSLWHRY